MDGLTGDTQRVADLLPGPTLASSERYLRRLNALGQPSKGEHRV